MPKPTRTLLPPLLAVAWLFRSKGQFTDLPHVVDAVSLFLDSSVELPLDEACKRNSLKLLERLWAHSQLPRPNNSWSLGKFLQTDRHYRQYQFTLSLNEAIELKNVEMVKWLAAKFPGYTVRAQVVVKAASAGCKELLQFFHDKDNSALDEAVRAAGAGLGVEWTGKFLRAAVASRRNDIVWWAHTHYQDFNNRSGALEAAVKNGDMPMAEWLIQHEYEWAEGRVGLRIAHKVAAAGDLDVLKWLDGKDQVENVAGVLVKAAEAGQFEVVRWLIDRDITSYDSEDDEDEGGGYRLTDLGGEASLAIHTAAVNGHLEIAKYLRARSTAPKDDIDWVLQDLGQKRQLRKLFSQLGAWNEAAVVSGKTMTWAAQKGFLNVVQWLVMEYSEDPKVDLFNYGRKAKCESSATTLAMNVAASNGHLDVVQYLHGLQGSMDGSTKKRKRDDSRPRSSPRCTQAAMTNAAANGHLDVVQWLHQNRSEGCSKDAMDGAAGRGHLDVVKWLHAHRSEGCTVAAMDNAASNGYLDVVQWLHSNRSEGCTARAMDSAAGHGHLAVVKWLHENTTVGCTTQAMDDAASNGHLHAVKWLHSNRSEGCTVRAMDQAAKYNELSLIRWLHANRSEGCSGKAMDNAAGEGHLAVLQWLHYHRGEGCSSATADLAAVNDSFEALLFLYFECHQQCTQESVVVTQDNGTPDIHDWILARHPEFQAAMG